jgi:hypothetical protein
MEQTVRRERETDEQKEREVVSRDGGRPNKLAKAFSLVPVKRGMSAAPASAGLATDWSTSLDLVRRAAQAMRAGAERVEQIEARAQAVTQRAAQELEDAQSKIEALEARLTVAEARAKNSAARAREAEGWLWRIDEAITQEIPESLRLLETVADPGDGG